MPQIKLQHVTSCSSEDKNHPAENLLKPEGTKKWQTASPGERQASVTLQFEKAGKIQGIDIGNNGSAFVEVLVGRSTDKSDQDFQVLLVASSFMSPLESKSGNNLNRVRMFGMDKLSNAAVDHKWDKVKIVCTQPFNKNCQYGISFIKFFSEPGANEKKPPANEEKSSVSLGAFKLKTEDEAKDSIKTGTLFANRSKDKPEVSPLSGAAAVRAAARLADEAIAGTSRDVSSARRPSTEQPSTPHTPVGVKRKQEESHYSNEKVKKKTSSSSSPAANSDAVTPSGKPSMRKQTTDSSVTSRISDQSDDRLSMKKSKSESEKTPSKIPFSKIMDKVVFVLSGFQNPARGQLRDKAIEMGAKYRPDWGQGCTHLVCAFANTPKFNAVNGRGKIVSKNWVSDCYKQRKLLPWRRYRLGDADSPEESSDESSDEDTRRPVKKQTPQKTAATSTQAKSPSVSKSPAPKSPVTSQTKPKDSPVKKTHGSTPTKTDTVMMEKDYAGSTDVSDGEDSGADTEDEIRRVKEEQTNSSKNKSSIMDEDPYAASTDEEDVEDLGISSNSSPPEGIPELPDFFSKKKFFLYGTFSPQERRVLVRYVTAFDGTIEDYMTEKVSHVITHSEWDDNFDQALADNPGLAFVKPQWVYACNDNNKFIPHQRFVVVPK